jgi:hypothetical protein
MKTRKKIHSFRAVKFVPFNGYNPLWTHQGVAYSHTSIARLPLSLGRLDRGHYIQGSPQTGVFFFFISLKI